MLATMPWSKLNLLLKKIVFLVNVLLSIIERVILKGFAVIIGCKKNMNSRVVCCYGRLCLVELFCGTMNFLVNKFPCADVGFCVVTNRAHRQNRILHSFFVSGPTDGSSLNTCYGRMRAFVCQFDLCASCGGPYTNRRRRGGEQSRRYHSPGGEGRSRGHRPAPHWRTSRRRSAPASLPFPSFQTSVNS